MVNYYNLYYYEAYKLITGKFKPWYKYKYTIIFEKLQEIDFQNVKDQKVDSDLSFVHPGYTVFKKISTI